jgi:hypothetical protein
MIYHCRGIFQLKYYEEWILYNNQLGDLYNGNKKVGGVLGVGELNLSSVSGVIPKRKRFNSLSPKKNKIMKQKKFLNNLCKSDCKIRNNNNLNTDECSSLFINDSINLDSNISIFNDDIVYQDRPEMKTINQIRLNPLPLSYLNDKLDLISFTKGTGNGIKFKSSVLNN